MKRTESGARHSPNTWQGLYDPRFEHDACGIAFVVNIRGHQSHSIILQALTALRNLDHRGARGSEPDTGDGAGILMQLPDVFLRQVCQNDGLSLPTRGAYGAGMLFLPHHPAQRRRIQELFQGIVEEEGQHLIGWREVPTDNKTLGQSACQSEPFVCQLFIGRNRELSDALDFERKLFVIRKRVEKAVNEAELGAELPFFVASLSQRTMVYKGMLTPQQLVDYYPDLQHPAMSSALALVHSRFSTNTFPSWERAHPNRYLIHNGEINTLRGNVNWMRAREAQLASELFGDDLSKILPTIDEAGSDSAIFDNVLEFLLLTGRSLPHAVMMMIPEPWSRHQTMSDEKRAFYEYHSCLMEPWDGPASIAFSDGEVVGAVLDRNGLRPSRYVVTKDDLVIMASEVGVLDIPAERIAYKGRLQPGRMLLIDTAAGTIVTDEALKQRIASARPYRRWLDKYVLRLDRLATPSDSQTVSQDALSGDLTQLQQAFGYTFEDLRVIMAPMATNGVEAIGSMGDDTPLAVLSEKPQPLFNYFKQLFAQVTNPPIDAIREEMVIGTEVMLGSEGNLLQSSPRDCLRLKLPHPILRDDDLSRIRALRRKGLIAAVLPILFDAEGGEASVESALAAVGREAEEAIAGGASLLILSDRGVSARKAAIPALLAMAALHHHLIRCGLRTRVSLLIETGEAREIHHFAALIGYGADAVNPYLALASIGDMLRKGLLTGISLEQAQEKYVSAVVKGVIKVISKMGISTIQSYHGAQIFEAVGLHRDVVERYFTGTPSRIGGAGLDVLAREVCLRHHAAFHPRPANGHALPAGGRYQWRDDGEYHLFNPATVHLLQRAVRSGDYEAYQRYAARVDDHNRAFCTLRGLLQFKSPSEAVALEEVESVASILLRFKTGAMSYGSISREAHETLAIAMNRLGAKSNTGEGGEDPDRYRLDRNGDSRNSAIKQVASGRFGVTSEYLVNAQEIQIKMAQGAKPGEGGQLPGHKVYPWIAHVRYSTPGVGLISPPPHHDIYSIEDLAQLIFDLKNANPSARISVKLVSEVGVGTVAAGVAKGHADVILISGHDGGTGASPQTSIKHAGLPWELGLAETHQTLLLNDLRSRVVLETDGQMRTGRDVAIAALLGAEEFGFATAPLVAIGCLMMRVCHLDTCPVGIATQNPELREKFAGDPQDVVNFMTFIAMDLREWMARLGFRTIDEMIGHTEWLQPAVEANHWKAGSLDLTPLLHQPQVADGVGRYWQLPQEHGIERTMDSRVLLALCRPALERAEPVKARLPIRNIDRTVGTILGSEVTRRYGAGGLPVDTIALNFDGSAGQSFGAFIPSGVTLTLAGDANDYLGKGLSGGKIVVYPPEGSTYVPEENVIVGNVAFYGATGGEAYIYGLAGERFCVRNSGMTAVVEGIGDHGCEYMTGGRVVVLGRTGRNFAAGMSGGLAYVLDEIGDFAKRCNQTMVDLEPLSEGNEAREVRDMIWRHAVHTGSGHAWNILAAWQSYRSKFVKVLPRDYRRMRDAISAAEQLGLDGNEAVMAAFEANKRDLARVTGN